MLRPLLNLVLGTILAFAVVRTLMPRTARESPADLRLRQAQWLSVAFALVAGYLLLLCVRAANVGGVPDRFGMILYLMLVATLGVAVPSLRGAWRRVNRERRSALDDARRAAGLPLVEGADEPAARHRGLTGEEAPPTRW